MWKRYLWLKNLAFLAVLAFLSAKIANTAIISCLPSPEAAIAPAAEGDRRGGNRTASKSKSLYRPIVKRNVFNSDSTGFGPDKKPPTPVADNTGPGDKPVPSELNVKLIGTVAGPKEVSFAVIEDGRSREQELFQVDDMIQDEARILTIERCKVVVLRNDQEEVLLCEEEEEGGDRRRPPRRTIASRRPSGNEGDGVRKISDTEFIVDEDEVEDALNNMNQLLTQIRVVPNFRNGQSNGFKVFAIKPRSIFAKIGLKNGDVIQRINDQDITSPDKAFSAFQELRNEKSLAVELLRRGKQKSLQYEIR